MPLVPTTELDKFGNPLGGFEMISEEEFVRRYGMSSAQYLGEETAPSAPAPYPIAPFEQYAADQAAKAKAVAYPISPQEQWAADQAAAGVDVLAPPSAPPYVPPAPTPTPIPTAYVPPVPTIPPGGTTMPYPVYPQEQWAASQSANQGLGGTPGIRNPLWGTYATGSPEYWEERGGWGDPMAFKTSRGIVGQTTLSPFQQYINNMYEPLQALGGMQGAFSQMPGRGQGLGGNWAPTGDYMTQWMQPYMKNPASMYNLANRMLGETLNMPYSEREGVAGLTGTDIGGLLGMGLRGSGLGPGAQWLAGRMQPEMENWQQQYPEWDPAVSQGGSFLDYVKQKYNLGRFFQ